MKTFKDPWYESYARGMLRAKGYQQASEEMVAQATGSLRMSVERIYRAVAFDVDGTLTADDPTSLQCPIVPIDREMAQVVAELLVRGVPVILITGRGASAKNAASDIRKLSNLSAWQIRRLYCVPYNGVCLWRTPLNDVQRFLGDQVTFFDWEQKDGFARALAKAMARIGDRHSELRFDPKAQSLRVIAPNRELRDVAFGVAMNVVEAHDWDKNLFVAKGLYSKNQWSLDVSPTNKRLALDKIAEFLDIPRDRILCIGDQGDRDGNDFDLLDSDSGFSVGDFSNARSERCDHDRTNGSPFRRWPWTVNTAVIRKAGTPKTAAKRFSTDVSRRKRNCSLVWQEVWYPARQLSEAKNEPMTHWPGLTGVTSHLPFQPGKWPSLHDRVSCHMQMPLAHF